MGDIKQILVSEELEPRVLFPKRICVDLCENLHLHNRNIRHEFSLEEWALYSAAMQNLYKASEYSIDKHKYIEGTHDFFVQSNYNTPYPTNNSAYFPNRFSIEECRDDTFHVHYRDLRIELTRNEFEQITNAFAKAKENKKKFVPFPYPDIKVPTLVTAPIDSIQPYDSGHLPGHIDKEHRDGIEYCKKLIKNGERIRPIVVNSNGQRTDGFKRYMAFKELGYKKIECLVDPTAPMLGVQTKLSMTMEPGEYEYLNHYQPLKKFDKKVARQNLLDTKKVLDKFGVEFFLCLGTALGAVRDGDFIEFDTDVDVACKHEKLIHKIPEIKRELTKLGFSVEGWSKPYAYQRSLIFSRNGVDVGLRDYALYKDYRFFADIRLFDELDICAVYPRELFDNLETIKFQGEDFLIPSPAEEFIEQTYGRYWWKPDPTRGGDEADVIGFWGRLDPCDIIKEQ